MDNLVSCTVSICTECASRASTGQMMSKDESRCDEGHNFILMEEGTKMAIYDKEQGLQSILGAVLGEYQSKGFRLAEHDDYWLIHSLFQQILSWVARSVGCGMGVPDPCRLRTALRVR